MPDSDHSDQELRIHCLNLALSRFKQCDIPEISLDIANMFYGFIKGQDNAIHERDRDKADITS